MTKWQVVFDGSEEVGSVRFGDGVVEVVAHFKSDHDARLFFGLLNEMKDELFTTDNRLGRVNDAIRAALREGNKP